MAVPCRSSAACRTCLHPVELLLCHNLDHTLLGTGLVPALNALKRGGALAPGCVVLPAAARVWCVGVRVLADPGVPVHMAATQSLYWSPVARAVDLDEPLGPGTAIEWRQGF